MIIPQWVMRCGYLLVERVPLFREWIEEDRVVSERALRDIYVLVAGIFCDRFCCSIWFVIFDFVLSKVRSASSALHRHISYTYYLEGSGFLRYG